MGTLSPPRQSRWLVGVRPGSRAAKIELLYDLIFVFAFLNVTSLVSADLDPQSVLTGSLVLCLLWWCWQSVVTLGTVVRADRGILPALGIATMAAVFVLAIAIPQSFADKPGELYGPLVFAVSYLLVRALTLAGFLSVMSLSGRTHRQLALVYSPALVAAALIGLAVAAPWWAPAGAARPARLILWTLALLVEFLVTTLLGRAGLAVVSAGHVAERHGLIVMIALGEGVLALGLGPGRLDNLHLTWPVILGVCLGIALVVVLFWLYFDTLAPAIEQAVHGIRDSARPALVRDVFAYLHLFMIMGIVSTALGLKLVLGAIAAPGGNSAPWTVVAILYGGVAFYLLASTIALIRIFGWAKDPSLLASPVTIVLLELLIAPAAALLPPLAVLALLVTICTALAVTQALTASAPRKVIKDRQRREEHMTEEALSRWRRENL